MGNTKSNLGEDFIIKGVEEDNDKLIENGIEYGVDFDKNVNGAPFVYNLMVMAFTKHPEKFNKYINKFKEHIGYVHKIKKPLNVAIYWSGYEKDTYYNISNDYKKEKSYIRLRFYFDENKRIESQHYQRIKHIEFEKYNNILDILYYLILNLFDILRKELNFTKDKQKYGDYRNVLDYIDGILTNITKLKDTFIERENESSEEESIDNTDKDVLIDDDTLCCICMDKKNSVLLRPCKHLCICEDHKDLKNCPICRTNIEYFEDVYC